MNKKRVFKINFVDSTVEEAKNEILKEIKKGNQFLALTINLEYLRRSSDSVLKEALKKADFILPDGMPIIWAAEIARRPLRKRVAGCDLGRELILASRQESLKIFLLATSSIGKRVGERAAKNFRKSDINIQGVTQDYHLTKRGETDPRIVKQIKKFQPDILLVGFGCQKQEEWILENQKSLGIPFAMGVGGSIDIWAGLEKRAPKWMQRIGLEWLFQIYKKPKKIWRYLLEIPAFCRLMAWAAKERVNYLDQER